MNAPMVVRAGAGRGAERRPAPQRHATTRCARTCRASIVCVPSTPADAKGLMKTALRAGDPVIMLEPKALFASKGQVPVGEDHFVPFGVARIARPGPRPHHRRRRPDRPSRARGRGDARARRHRLRGDRPPHHHAARRRRPSSTACARPTACSSSTRAGRCAASAPRLGQAVNELAFDELDAPVGRLHTAPISHPFAPVARTRHAGRRRPHRRRGPRGASTAARRSLTTGAPRGIAAATVPRRRAARQPRPRRAATAAARRRRADHSCPSATSPSAKAGSSRWLEAVGDAVTAGETIAEIETDKAVVEIEAPVSGILAAIEAEVGAQWSPMGGRIGVVPAA